MGMDRIYHVEDGSVWVEPLDERAPGEDGADARRRRPSLAALLSEAGIASDEQIKEALAEGARSGEKLGEVVVRRGWATEDQLGALLARQWRLPFIDADALSVDSPAFSGLSIAEARDLGGCPVRLDNDVSAVAIAEPSESRFAALRESFGEVVFVVVARCALERLLQSRPAVGGALDASSSSASASSAAESDPVMDDFADDGEAERVLGDLAAAGELHASESTSDRLGSVHAEVRELEKTLQKALQTIADQQRELDMAREAREQDADTIGRLETRLGEQRAELDATQEVREQDAATIRRLETQLDDNGDLFTVLKDKVEYLRHALDSR